MKRRNVIVPPTIAVTQPNFRFSVHLISNMMRLSDVETVFPLAKAHHTRDTPLHCIVTFQQMTDSMIQFSEDASLCKDEGRDRFFRFMHDVKSRLHELDSSREHWVDWVDPATGLPASGQCGSCAYSEVDGIEQLLVLDVTHVGDSGGGCRMVNHPEFGLAVYPSSGFVCAPSALLTEAFKTL